MRAGGLATGDTASGGQGTDKWQTDLSAMSMSGQAEVDGVAGGQIEDEIRLV